MNRREFNRLATAALAAPGGLATAAAAVRFDPSTKTWFLSNRFFERELTFDAARGLITRQFVDRRTGRDWAAANQARWGSEIFLIINEDVLYGASPANRFQYLDHEVSDNLLRIRLALLPQELNVTLHYRVFDDSPLLLSDRRPGTCRRGGHGPGNHSDLDYNGHQRPSGLDRHDHRRRRDPRPVHRSLGRRHRRGGSSHSVFGSRRLSWAMLFTGYLVGIPVFFDAAGVGIKPKFQAVVALLRVAYPGSEGPSSRM